MKAVRFDAFCGPIALADVAEPECPADGVIVEVGACGVCRSDWHGWKGSVSRIAPPHVPGHEFAGVIAETGRDCRRFRKGMRVTAPFILACGQCPDCVGGDATVCAHQHVAGFSSWGAYAERVAVPRADFNLVELPGEMDFATAAGMGCRVTTAWRAVVDRARLAPGEWIAVHGCGGVGLSAVMIGAALGARVLAVDINPGALEMARKMGANHTLNAEGLNDVGGAVREITGGGAQVSVEALGITATFENSLRGLAPLGRHVQIGMPSGSHATPALPLYELIYARQLQILGTRGLAASRFPALFAAIQAGRMDPSKLVTRSIGLEEAPAAIVEMDGFSRVGVTVIDRFQGVSQGS
jgi:alcohol dehydrogenase